MARNAQLDNEIVIKLLHFAFAQDTARHIALCVNIKEGGNSAKRHSSAILLFNRGKVGKIRPLDGFAGVGGRPADIKAIHFCHFLHIAKEGDLLKEFFGETRAFRIEITAGERLFILFLLGNQMIHTVKRHAAIVADNAASAISVGQSRDHMALAGGAHFISICTEHTVVVGGAEAEFFFHLIRKLVAVCLASLARHTDAAKGIHTAAKRATRLHTNNQFVFFVNIAGRIA